jgi:hypothetical protein
MMYVAYIYTSKNMFIKVNVSLVYISKRPYLYDMEIKNKNTENFIVNQVVMAGIKVGAKWQAERMYSEEEVEQIFNIGQMIKNYGDYKPYTFKEALEQFKKK